MGYGLSYIVCVCVCVCVCVGGVLAQVGDNNLRWGSGSEVRGHHVLGY